MIKALYGTRSGGARWHDRLFDILQELKFKPSKADPDVWMRPEPGGTCYEYIAVYVDDLAIAAKDPQAFCNELKEKHLKRYAKTSKRLIRAVKQSRIRQVRASAQYQHGFQVPKDYNDAIRLDKENSNTHWQDAMDLELTQIHEYKVLKDTGKAQFHNGKAVTPDGFQKIRVHFVYAVKHGQIQSKTCCRWTSHQRTC